jgi:hypothetical protein
MLAHRKAKQALGSWAGAHRGEPASPRGISGSADRGTPAGRSQAQFGLAGQNPNPIRPQLARALKLPDPQQEAGHTPRGGRPIPARTGTEGGPLLDSNAVSPGPTEVLPQPQL